MKTSHQIARELLELPDEEIHIEGWCPMDDYEMKVSIYEANEDGGIILHQQKKGESTRLLRDIIKSGNGKPWMVFQVLEMIFDELDSCYSQADKTIFKLFMNRIREVRPPVRSLSESENDLRNAQKESSK